MLSVLSFLVACQTMEEPGAMFKQVKIAETTTTSEETTNTKEEAEEAVDPMFQSREEVLVVGGSPAEEPPEPVEPKEEVETVAEPETLVKQEQKEGSETELFFVLFVSDPCMEYLPRIGVPSNQSLN